MIYTCPPNDAHRLKLEYCELKNNSGYIASLWPAPAAPQNSVMEGKGREEADYQMLLFR